VGQDRDLQSRRMGRPRSRSTRRVSHTDPGSGRPRRKDRRARLLCGSPSRRPGAWDDDIVQLGIGAVTLERPCRRRSRLIGSDRARSRSGNIFSVPSCRGLEPTFDVFPADELFQLAIPIVELGRVGRRRVAGFVRVVDRVGLGVAHAAHVLMEPVLEVSTKYDSDTECGPLLSCSPRSYPLTSH
jgi:hypothetical protein